MSTRPNIRAWITGVTGFVGVHLAEHLAEHDRVLLGSSLHARWPRWTPTALAERVETFAWDLAVEADQTLRERIVAFRPQEVYHLAAMGVPADCGLVEPTSEAWAVNVEGTRRVLELVNAIAEKPRLVFVSSSHVYAAPSPTEARVDETSATAPMTGYGHAKLAAEREVLQSVRRAGLDAVIARAFQHVGPGQTAALMLPQWIGQFVDGGDAPVAIHTLEATIDLSDVRDIVRAYRLLAERGEPGEVFNVGSGVPRTSGQIFELLRQAAGSSRPPVETRPGRRQDPIADITHLQRRTGWRAEIPVSRTVADAYAASLKYGL